MLEINKVFNKLAVLEIPSDRGLSISYNNETGILNLLEKNSNNVVAKSVYEFAEYLVAKDIKFDKFEKVDNGIYKLNYEEFISDKQIIR